MIVPIQVLQNLKCSNCEDLLSCGPVLVKQDGSDICGRCSNLEETAVLNKPYNELAEMCMFPCKYEANGCYEKNSFSSMKQHEADCEFRTYICPVMPSGSCEWIGSRNKILEHTRESHPEKILEHPCQMEHDVRTASLKTFLTTAFDVLFLIQVKVCLATYTIYHSVRKIGEISQEHIYKYQLNIENANGSLIRKGDVAPQGCLALQEDSSIAVEINTLMKALNGFKNTKFILTLQTCMKCFYCTNMNTADQVEVLNKINKIFCCQTCSLIFSCENSLQGCKWKGKKENNIHKLLFCTWFKQCDVCKKDIEEFNMLEHMRNKNHLRVNFNHLFGKYWSMNVEKNIKTELLSVSFQNKSYLLVYSKARNLLNRFIIIGRQDDIKMKIDLIFKNSRTKHTLHYNMTRLINGGQSVWLIDLHDDRLQSFLHDNKFEIGVNIYSYE